MIVTEEEEVDGDDDEGPEVEVLEDFFLGVRCFPFLLSLSNRNVAANVQDTPSTKLSIVFREIELVAIFPKK